MFVIAWKHEEIEFSFTKQIDPASRIVLPLNAGNKIFVLLERIPTCRRGRNHQRTDLWSKCLRKSADWKTGWGTLHWVRWASTALSCWQLLFNCREVSELIRTWSLKSSRTCGGLEWGWNAVSSKQNFQQHEWRLSCVNRSQTSMGWHSPTVNSKRKSIRKNKAKRDSIRQLRHEI